MCKSGINLSIVVAAYNEDTVISQNMKRIVDELSTRPEVTWELICVDDGSNDRTGELMEEFAKDNSRVLVFHHRRNFGQGRALRTAFDMCKGEIIVTLDADLSYGPEYIYRLNEAIIKEKVEIALASPYAKGGTVRNVPFYRHLLSRWGNRYLARMSHYPISTSTCVVRAYRHEILDTLSFSSDGMEIQLEILMKAAMMGFRVCEVPAHLAWADAKVEQADFRRVSKMRILSTIRMYLMMGWLSRPAYIFMVTALLLIIPGLYMAGWLLQNIFVAVNYHLNQGFNFDWALSNGLKDVFTKSSYSFAISGGLIIVGLLILIFSLLVIQNKFYFDELYRLSQQMLKERKNK